MSSKESVVECQLADEKTAREKICLDFQFQEKKRVLTVCQNKQYGMTSE